MIYYTKTFDGKFINPPITSFVPHITSYYEYLDVNQDKNLQKKVTMFFYRVLIDEWIVTDIQFKKFKNKKLLKNKDGLQLIYKILNKLVKKGDTNWYDLRDPQYELTKDFIFYQLSKYFASLQ